MTLFAITPEQFQDLALRWITVIFAVLTGLAVGAAVLLPKLIALSKDVQSLLRSRDIQRQDIQTTQANLTQVALAVNSQSPNASNPPSNGQ